MIQLGHLKKTFPQESPFIILTLSPTDKGFPQLEAFELTDQFVDLHKRRYFLVDNESEEHIMTKEVVYCNSKEFRRLELQFFYLPLRLTQKEKLSKIRTEFPVENRLSVSDQRKIEVAKAILFQKNPKITWDQRLSDFHLLLFLVNFLSTEEIVQMAVSISANLPILDGSIELLRSYLQS